LGTGHLGFEATGGYAPAKVAGETVNETRTNLLLANARLLLALTPVTSFGGTVGLGFRFGGGDDSRVGFRVDIEDYL
jgi:hypothetical protein